MNLRAIILLLIALPLAAGPAPAAGQRPVVAATTTMIRSMVELLAGDELEVCLLVPPGTCPGHFDFRPADAVGLSRAGLIIRHDYQGYLDRKLAGQNPGMEIAVLETPGHLVIPVNYLTALGRVKELLEARFPGLSATLGRNFSLAAGRVERAGREARERIAGTGLAGTRAVASARQEGFLRWAGMEVVASFPNSPEELSVLQLKELVDSARAGRAVLVAGNFQGGGPAIAEGVASELGVPLCILSSFPGTSERNATYFDLLQDNLDRLVRTLPEPAQP